MSYDDIDQPPHFGNPFAEQRALAAGRTDIPIGQWAYDALRIERGTPKTDAEKQPPKGQHLVFLHLDGTEQELPPPGSSIFTEADQIGTVTSSAWHYELGPIALALIADEIPETAPLIVHAETDGHLTLIAASQTAI